MYFTKLSEDHRIPNNIGINERLEAKTRNIKIRIKWNKFEVYMQEQVFIFRNNYEVVNLLNVFHHKVSFHFFVTDVKKIYCDEKPFPFILDTIAWPFEYFE